MSTTANELIVSIREMKKTNPAEYEVFEKNFVKEMTEGVKYWGATNGFITFWKLFKELEDEDDNFGAPIQYKERCFGEEWGGFCGIETRTMTKKMVKKMVEGFSEDEDEDEDEDENTEEED